MRLMPGAACETTVTFGNLADSVMEQTPCLACH